jgi:SAM-dependent methyltransferase
MDSSDPVRSFLTTGRAYDRFMGRYSGPLAVAFADAAAVAPGMSALDLGCGPGALTGVLVDRLGAGLVAAVDPSPSFVAECAARHPGVAVRAGRAEEIPFGSGGFDLVLAQLVLHFVADPARCAHEVRRVLRPGGLAAACVWDFAEGMQLLRAFWDAALALDPSAPDEARTLRFGRRGEIADWLETAGFDDVTETTLTVSVPYPSFDDLWDGFLAGVGPAGAYCVGLPEPGRAALREQLFGRLGSPDGPLSLRATARCASGRSPR